MPGERGGLFLLVAATVLGFALLSAATDAQSSDATTPSALFEEHCAICHATPAGRAPTSASLRCSLSFERC